VAGNWAGRARGYGARIADLDLVRRLVAADHGLATVATRRRDGSIQTSLVNAGGLSDPVTGADAVAFVARSNTAKVANLRRDPYASVTWRAGWEWVTVEGPVTIVGPDDAADGIDADGLRRLLRDVFAAAGGTHDDWDEYDRVMAAERRAAVFVAADRVTSNG
jgi:PPOX class probable F420-dependent enzyme